MRRPLSRTITLLGVLLCFGSAHAQTANTDSRHETRSAARTTERSLRIGLPAHSKGSGLNGKLATASGNVVNIAPTAAPNLPVIGGGTLGRLTKWSGFTSSNSVIGNSTIFEDKYGMVGIGTDTPTSRLSVAGLIQSLSGGYKFPDGTVQATAGVAPGQVVRSLNGLMGDLTLLSGSNITIMPGQSSLTLSATGLLSAVSHDGTLTGNGTAGSPLGLAVPLTLSSSQFPTLFASNTGDSPGLIGQSAGTIGAGVVGISGLGSFPACGNAGVCGTSTDQSGVIGISTNSIGLVGVSFNSVAIIGRNTNGPFSPCPDSAVCGTTDDDAGVAGLSVNGSGVRGVSTNGLAGEFFGNVVVTGTLSKGGGSFKIDHPLDPENRYLYHSFVESPDMKNIYDGNVVTNENGEATVTLPEYFEALNRDFRYQLTVIGTFAQAIIAEEIKDNRFVIRTSAPGVKVSWLVTGIRQDAWANKNRIPIEVEKQERERGYYLHPEAFDKPEERGTEWARNPEMMQRIKRERAEFERKLNKQ